MGLIWPIYKQAVILSWETEVCVAFIQLVLIPTKKREGEK